MAQILHIIAWRQNKQRGFLTQKIKDLGMVGRKRTIDRRKNKRYKAAEGAYAAISPNSNKIGQIIDISMGGLCFKYINPENKSKEPVNLPIRLFFLVFC
ncbi:hypothetical protein [Desulfobacter hydrogenophilus]|nr:hypothetical protein [Desulfobacter hydrogenophilus]